MKKSIIAALLMAASGGAIAADNSGYIGVGVGSSSTTIKDDTTGFSYTANSRGGMGRIFAGVRNGNFGVEGEVIGLGTFDFPGFSVRAHGFGVSAVGYLPLATEFSFFGKAGLADITTDATPAPGFRITAPASQSRVGVSLGLGAQFDVNQNVAFRAALESYPFSAFDSNLKGRIGVFDLSAMFKF